MRSPRSFRRWLSGRTSPALLQPEPPRGMAKRDAACCRARVDKLGRWPIGYCSPGCIRRPGKVA